MTAPGTTLHLVTKSGFYDVDRNDPSRLVAALDRRSGARLYDGYRDAIVQSTQTTTGVVVDVGAGGGHLVQRLSDGVRPVFGIEPSAELVKAASTHGRPVFRATGSALPFRSASVGCVVAERVLQHVDNIDAMLTEMCRVLEADGLLLLADPHHREVRLVVPHLQDVADRLVRWRARAGTACPAAVEISSSWLDAHGYTVSQREFLCVTADFSDARVVTNFPEWAQLAKDAGEDITAAEVAAWGEHWRHANVSGRSDTAWFYWPVVLTAATRSGA